MTHSHRRKTSVNLYFRMDVPKDIRPLVGQSSWQLSLGTSDPALADVRRAAPASHYKAKIIRYRGIIQAQAKQDAAVLVGRAFARLAAHFRSMDAAIAAELQKIALIVRSSWSVDHARAVTTRSTPGPVVILEPRQRLRSPVNGRGHENSVARVVTELFPDI